MLAPAAPRSPAGDPSGVFSSPSRLVVSLLQIDADLGAGLPVEDLPAATLASRAEAVLLAKGPWQPAAAAPGDLGLLLLAGLAARIVRVGRRESLELVGPGDLVRPGADEDASLVACDVRWEILEPGRAALLDQRFCRGVQPWPQIGAALSARATRRARWLAVQAAVNAHPTVEERVMLMLCHLGERMGRVTPDGVVLDLPLSHRLLSHCVHALRPSVTAALLRLRDDGRLRRPSRRTWVVTHAGLDYAAGLCRQPVLDC